jgi:outer membrane protein
MRRVLALVAVGFALGAQGAPLTLDEAMRRARTKHPSLQRQAAQVRASDARADQARAALLPQVTARASLQRSSSARTFVTSDPSALTSGANSFNATLNANQLLWDFGRTTGRLSAARSSAEAQRETARAQLLQVLLNVSTAFFDARAQQSLVGVAKEALQNQEKHLAQVEAFIEVGTRPEIDRALARTDAANARVQLIRAENAAAIAKARLNQAMGESGPLEYEVADASLTPVKGEDAAAEQLVDEAFGRRPELAALARQLEAQRASISSARGGYWPSFSLSAAALESGPSLSTLRPGWSATLALSWPLFEGFRTQAEVREASAQLEALQADVESERQQLRFEIEETRLSVRGAKAALVASDEALAAARERLRLAEGRYATGVGQIIELSDAQLAVTAAAAQRIQAEYELGAARARLTQVLGRFEE